MAQVQLSTPENDIGLLAIIQAPHQFLSKLDSAMIQLDRHAEEGNWLLAMNQEFKCVDSVRLGRTCLSVSPQLMIRRRKLSSCHDSGVSSVSVQDGHVQPQRPMLSSEDGSWLLVMIL
jgi:hypothetical protein